jgi:hypothetical protein
MDRLIWGATPHRTCSGEVADEDSLIDCHHYGSAHGRQRPSRHEQRLQEQSSRVVRSNVYRTASHKNRAQLKFQRLLSHC